VVIVGAATVDPEVHSTPPGKLVATWKFDWPVKLTNAARVVGEARRLVDTIAGIDAIVERLDIKQALFEKLEKLSKTKN